MKRELKEKIIKMIFATLFLRFKTDPDEKGTERILCINAAPLQKGFQD